MKSYDYAHRKGIDEISWERFGELSRALTEHLSGKKIDIVIARDCSRPQRSRARCDGSCIPCELRGGSTMWCSMRGLFGAWTSQQR